LVQAGLLKGAWPRNSAGKLLNTGNAISALGQVLAKRNPDQRAAIFNALGLPRQTTTGGTRATAGAAKGADEPYEGEAADEETFLEGEKRAAKQTVRNPSLRVAAKRRWGLRCYCCGFDFEQFYGSVAKGLAIVHHLQPVAAAKGKVRNATVRDVRIVCANCHQVIHVAKEPIDVDDLKKHLAELWTPWNEAGVARRT
jgi:hypothetical protein